MELIRPAILIATMLGWIVTYIIKNRQGGPSSGYISSGFFGGTLRYLRWLLPSNNKHELCRNDARTSLAFVVQQTSKLIAWRVRFHD